MKIYTKTGDAGRTRLVGGTEIAKDDARVEAYGQVDEVNSQLGVAIAELERLGGFAPLVNELRRVQNRLFNAGSVFACEKPELRAKLPQVSTAHIEELERSIDQMTAELPPLREFILPGGTIAASLLHLCRTRCRTAERASYAVSETAPAPETRQALVYLNRLSDYFFVAARFVNHREHCPDITWKKDE